MLPAVLKIEKSSKTVFGMRDLVMMFPDIDYVNLKRRVSHWVQTGRFRRIRRGVIVKDSYNVWELATKLYTPSYISLETILAKNGLIFQKYNTITLISYVNREIKVDGNEFRYQKMAEEIAVNSKGVENIGEVMVAGIERAFLDTVYIRKNYHFDNLKPINWDKVYKLVEIYENKIMKKRVDSYYQIYKEEYV